MGLSGILILVFLLALGFFAFMNSRKATREIKEFINKKN
jgi:preprotein translocase subunit YajC